MENIFLKNNDKLKEIEKSIIKKYRKEIYRPFVKAVNDFNLVEEGDHIAVCISGGKDSFLLAKCLEEFQRHSLIKFKLTYLVMNPGYAKENLEQIKNNAKLLNIDIQIFESNIFEVVKESKGKSPCYLCARMRRGFLYARAQELGCNKIALGHHFDDVIETILLNQIYNGNFSGMMPILDSTNFENMKLIRPLFYVKEKNIVSWVKSNNLVFIDCACSVTKKQLGKRLEIKKLINYLNNLYENADINIFNSMFNVNPNTTKNVTK